MTKSRLNTQVSFIPFLSTQIGNNVLAQSEVDKEFSVRSSFVGRAHQDKDIGIPIPVYAENILPTTLGWESVGYKLRIPPLLLKKVESDVLDQVINLKSGSETNILFSPSQGRNYINFAGQWIPGYYNNTYAGMVTSAYVKMNAYIFYQRQELLSYSSASSSFSQEQFKGLEAMNIDGITMANNYLIAWNETTIFWSSVLDPLDFVPSLSSGAGSQNPTQVRGKIIACLPIADGFIIYTSANAVSASWSGNIRYPWTFREIPGSAGIRKIEHVTFEANYNGHFAWTVDGLQRVNRESAQHELTEITDFITGRIVEEYIGIDSLQPSIGFSLDYHAETDDILQGKEPGPNILQQYHLAEEPWVKLALVGTRYLLVSYGYKLRGQYEAIIVYDLILNRYGKLRIPHVDTFEYVAQNIDTPITKEVIGILQSDGTVLTVDPSLNEGSEGILLYGRLKHQRGQWIDLNGIKIQTLLNKTPELFIIPSYTGAEFNSPVIPYLALDARNTKEWYCRVGGESMNLLLKGAFSLSSLEIDYDSSGEE